MAKKKQPGSPIRNSFSRRDFLWTSGAAGAAVLLPSCSKKSNPSESDGNILTDADVALKKLSDYNYSKLKSSVESMLDQTGGVSSLVKSGDKVAIKINLTGGGTWVERQLGCPAEESIWTHSSVIRAVGEALIDAGAGQISIVESGGDEIMYNPRFGYMAVTSSLGAAYIDLNKSDPYSGYEKIPVATRYNFLEFKVNPILSEVDLYVSIAKMKCHYTAGITLSMKNNVGMVPGNLYSGGDGGGTRWGLHGVNGELTQAGWHLPRSIVDLNSARPIDLAVIDGISTMDKGEGSWVPNFRAPLYANALLIGRDPVKTDAVGMQVMGFDPLTPHYEAPFVISENWLLKAREKGMGDPNPENIRVSGNSPDDFPMKFHPCDPNPEVTGKASAKHWIPYRGQHPADRYRVS